MSQSGLENNFEQYLKFHKITGYVKEWLFAADWGKKWRSDFAFIPEKVAVEVQGGIYIQGRHLRPAGYLLECEKREAYLILGWKLYEIPGPWILKGNRRIWDERIKNTLLFLLGRKGSPRP